MKKVLLIGGGVVGVAVIGAIAVIIFVLSSIDSLIQEAVETYDSEITQAEVDACYALALPGLKTPELIVVG